MPTNPRTPTGTPLEKGYQCAIQLANVPTLEIFERTLQPAGLDVGEKVDITTQHNEDVMTYAAPDLIEVTDSQSVVGYDPAALDNLLAQLRLPQLITVFFPNGDKWTYYGYLKSFQPNSMSRTAMPEATVTFVATNVNPTDSSESTPTFVAASS